MKASIAVLMMMVASTVVAQQTNALDTLLQSCEKQQQSVLVQYGKSLDTATANLKKKGDLDGVLLLQTEQKRFDTEQTVPSPADAGDPFRPASEAYHRSMAALMGQYVAALEGLIKKEVAADRIEEAKVARAEKDRASFVLADIQTRLPVQPIPADPDAGAARNVAAVKQVYLADMPEESARVGWGALLRGKLLDGNGRPLTVNGAGIEHGLFAHATSIVTYDIAGQGFQSLKGDAGLRDHFAGEVRFVIYGDGKKLWQSAILKGSIRDKTTTAAFTIPVKGVKKLVLEVDNLRSGDSDHSIWIDPVLSQ